MSADLRKKIFISISGNEARLKLITELIEKRYEGSVIYTADSCRIGLLKIKNTPPDVVIIDTETELNNWIQSVDTLLFHNTTDRLSVIILGHPPEEEKFLDEIVTGQLSFSNVNLAEDDFSKCLARGLNFTSHAEASSFRLRYLTKGDILIKENEKAEFVYILRRGSLQAYVYAEKNKVVIGKIEEGEFVGEMAYINNEPRSANVEALTDSELIEIPVDHLDKILYLRPSWSKALMKTLTKRLKTANKNAIE